MECPHSGCSPTHSPLRRSAPTTAEKGPDWEKGRAASLFWNQVAIGCSTAGSHAPQATRFPVAASTAALGVHGCVPLACVLRPKELDVAFIILLRGCRVRGRVLGAWGTRVKGLRSAHWQLRHSHGDVKSSIGIQSTMS